MTAPPNLPAALFLHAGSRPEEPWLFRPEGWDWRWHSWGEIAREVLARAESLSGYAAGSRYAFPYTARPEDVVLDLAIQAAGLVAVPGEAPPPEPSPPRPSSPAPSHPTSPGEEGEERDERDSRDEQGHRGSFFPSPGEVGWGGAGEGPGVRVRAGGAVILRNGEPIELSPAELIAMAERLQERIGPSGERDIVVLSGSLEIPEERSMLAWATVAGAAVVLEPNPALRAATAAWVRPTVFHGAAAELAALRSWAEKERPGWLRRRPRLPFRRLRTILVTGSETPGEEAFWRERGVRVARV